MNAQKQNVFSNILYFQKTENAEIVKTQSLTDKIVRCAEYDAKDGEN